MGNVSTKAVATAKYIDNGFCEHGKRRLGWGCLGGTCEECEGKHKGKGNNQSNVPRIQELTIGEKSRCKSITHNRTKCKNHPMKDSEYCYVHTRQACMNK